jgi:hypothetical protein
MPQSYDKAGKNQWRDGADFFGPIRVDWRDSRLNLFGVKKTCQKLDGKIKSQA